MAVKKYSAKKNVKLSKHFMSNEFCSHVNGTKTTDTIYISPELVKKLEKFFAYGIESVVILSGYRNKQADISVGGNGVGAHTLGIAADIICYKGGKALSGEQVACLAQLIGFTGIGITGSTGCHVDVRTIQNYTNGHWWGDERNGNDYITDFFSYRGISKAKLFGELEYYDDKCYTCRSTKKTPIHHYAYGASVKKHYSKGKKARVFAEKNGRAKVLSGWISLQDIKKI